MDSALQASSLLAESEEMPLMLPFAVEELEVFGKCTSGMWVYARNSTGSRSGDKIVKRDIDLCDEHGRVCVRLKGLSFREAEADRNPNPGATFPETLESFMLEPVWKPQAVHTEGESLGYARHLVILCGMTGFSSRDTAKRPGGMQFVQLELSQPDIAERFHACADQVFEMIRDLLTEKPQERVLLQVVVPSQGDQQLFAGLTGLLQSAELEHARLIGQTIILDTDIKFEELVAILEENKISREKRIRYQKGQRFGLSWNELDAKEGDVPVPWKDEGYILFLEGREASASSLLMTSCDKPSAAP